MPGEVTRYRSLAREGTAEVTEMKSRFIGYAAPVSTEEEARDYIARVHARHPDCSAVLYGYILGMSGQIQRFDDSHEPSGGIPILEALKRPGVTGAVCVVVRYFGGVKLGAGNLGRTFGQTAILAVEAAHPCVYERSTRLMAEIDYPLLGKVKHYLASSPARLEGISYGIGVTLTLLVRSDDEEELTRALTDLTSAHIEILPVENCFFGWDELPDPQQTQG